MKLLFAIKALDDIKGGAERVLADVTSGLADREHTVSVLTFDSQDGNSFYQLNNNVTRICLGIGNTQRKATLVETWQRIIALRNRIKHENPDVVIAFMHSMFIPTAFALIGTGIPVIASEHIVPAHYKTRPVQLTLLLLSSMFVRKITVLSDSVKASYPRFFHKKMIAIANPVSQPAVMAKPQGNNIDRKIILNVGRLDPQKNQKTLIKAFKQLETKHPDWDIRIMGDGPLRSELETLIKQLQLQERVFLPGTTPDIASEYQKAHIFALPSNYESFGLATAEAMSHGLPAIGFADCPGTNELITHDQNGILVAGLGNVSFFAAALDELMSSPDLRACLGNTAQHRIEPFLPDRIVNQWEKVIFSVLS